MIDSQLVAARSTMQAAENVVRAARAIRDPADRTELLMRAYRLSGDETKAALYAALVAREVLRDQPRRSDPTPATEPTP